MRALLCAVAVAFSSAAFAQDNAVQIPYAPGPRTVLDIEEVRERTSVGLSGPNGTARTSTTLEITGSAAPYRAIWTTTRVEAGGAVATAATPGAAQYLIGEPVVLTLSEDGAPISVEGWDEIRRNIMQIIEERTPEADRTAEWRTSMAATDRVFASMDSSQAARLMFQQASILSLCQHTGLELGQPMRSEAMTPNPMGGLPIRTLVAYELTSVDRAAGVANILFTSSFDPESARASVQEMVERMARETGRPIPPDQLEQFRTMEMNQNTRAECVVDLQSGIVRSIDYRVSIVMGSEGSRTDHRSIRVTRR